jgi:hypothetical protein
MSNQTNLTTYTNTKFLGILRNPYGFTKEEIKQAQLDACDAYESMLDSYTNMRDFAEESGLNTTADGSKR